MPVAPWHELTRGKQPSFPPSSRHESLEVAVAEEEELEVEPMALPVAVLIGLATFTLAFAKTVACPGTSAPTFGPQIHL